MKTTLDLDDTLRAEATIVAAKRRTTLNAIVERALRREILPTSATENPDPERFEVGPLGILALKRRPSETLTAEQFQELIDHQCDEEDAHLRASALSKS